MKILVFQHVEHEHPGYINEYAQEKDIKLDVIEFWKSYKIPDFSEYKALIIMGGPMGAYEDYPSRNDEIEFINKAVGKIPILGFCLGSQLIAYALKAKVYANIKNSKKVKEVGYFDISLTPDGQNSQILKDFPDNFKALEWHGDIFELPAEAKLLASSEICQNQVFSYNNCFGFLFHFEFTPSMIAQQIEIDKEWIHEDNIIDELLLLKETREKASVMKEQCYQLLDNFLGNY